MSTGKYQPNAKLTVCFRSNCRFINDDRNEISESDIQRRLRPGKDSVLGEYVEETIVFQPTLEDLCTRYDIDDYACETNKRRYHFFNFNLICKADQGSYFERENDDQEAMVGFRFIFERM